MALELSVTDWLPNLSGQKLPGADLDAGWPVAGLSLCEGSPGRAHIGLGGCHPSLSPTDRQHRVLFQMGENQAFEFDKLRFRPSESMADEQTRVQSTPGATQRRVPLLSRFGSAVLQPGASESATILWITAIKKTLLAQGRQHRHPASAFSWDGFWPMAFLFCEFLFMT